MLNLFKSTLLLFIVFLFVIGTAYPQKNNEQEKYSKVRIFATSVSDFQKIQNNGLFFDGGINKPGQYFETWLSADEIVMLKASSVPYQVLIDDWYSYYSSLPKMSAFDVQKAIQESADNYNVYHSIYGTMGGHLKVAEINAKLDSLRLQYPTLVSEKFSIGNTYENRPMWTVRITNNPDAPTGRPEVYYNGVTHAREPLSMENVLYYVYWLVENYNIDPIATYILNNREIYWTPIVNVDGYYYNETTNPTGGGMWRANRHITSGSCGPVDLNRNYGTYNFWNSSNGGSSTNNCNGGQGSYRGVAPFSEPETQNVKAFVNSRNFTASLSYHTYGNYLIKPWAWCDPLPTSDDAIFNNYGADITAVNNFKFGTPFSTVGYKVRGSCSDWFYSIDSTGHSRHVFDMTPEVGLISFWPPQAKILPEAQTCLYMNTYYSLISGPYAELRSATLNKTSYIQNETGNFKVVFRNKGLLDAQNVKVEFAPISDYFTVPVQTYIRTSIPTFVSDSTTFNFTINSNCPNNTALTARLRIKQNDTIIVFEQNYNIFIGTGYIVLADSAENGTSNWLTMTNWAIVTNKYLSPTHSFKGSCLSSTVSQMISIPLNISAYPVVYLSFYQKYAFETTLDFGFVDISSDNGTSWQKIATFNGVDSSSWKMQSFNITSLVNGSSNMRVRFRDSCDGSDNWDGWYVDNIKITAYQPSPITGVISRNIMPGKYNLEQNFPNPFNPVTQINYSIAKQGFVKISVYDLLGREVRVLVNEVKNAGNYSIEFYGANLSSGIYFYKIESNGFTDTKKLTLIK
jgi:carboxypeptidase T